MEHNWVLTDLWGTWGGCALAVRRQSYLLACDTYVITFERTPIPTERTQC
jgi:hypothetical protein